MEGAVYTRDDLADTLTALAEGERRVAAASLGRMSTTSNAVPLSTTEM